MAGHCWLGVQLIAAVAAAPAAAAAVCPRLRRQLAVILSSGASTACRSQLRMLLLPTVLSVLPPLMAVLSAGQHQH